MMKGKNLLLASVLAILTLASCGGDPATSSGNSSSGGSAGGGSSSSGGGSSSITHDEPLANGVLDYQGASTEEKAEILATMEEYAMDHHLAGIPLYDDAGYQLFSPRITLASNTFIPNYGFGISDSTLNPSGNMYNGQTATANGLTYPNYYNSYATEDSGTFNYWNSNGEDVSGKNAMITASFFSVTMNETRNGYVWRNDLSKTERPIMLDENGNEQEYTDGATSRFWRIYPYTVADEEETGRNFRYAISRNSSLYDTWNNVGIELEDYLVPFKVMLDNGFIRASTLITDSSGFAGAYDYLYGDANTRDWANVGIQINEELGCIDFEFITPKTQFYAMYNLSSSLFSPIPQAYLDQIGGPTRYGVIGSSSNPLNNVDNLLSCGQYIVDSWEQEVLTVYSRNELFFRAEATSFAGYTERVYPQNEEGAYNDFINGRLDDITVPSQYISQHTSDPLAHRTLGQTTLKINVNSCTPEQWEYYFGVAGTAYVHQPSNYWDVKPIMSNDNFLDGVFFSIDRQTLAQMTGHNVALGYLSDAYMLDAETDLSYRGTPAGQRVLSRYTDVNANGYDPSLAEQLFRIAIEEELAKGTMERGDYVTIYFKWRYQRTIDEIGEVLAQNIEEPFNRAASEYGIELDVYNEVAGPSYADCYTKMDQGEYDFAEGAITGNVLNPIEFMSVVCTNERSQGFTVNWGDRTDIVNEDDPLVYDDMRWSYDAFYVAANGAAIVREGLIIDPVTAGTSSFAENGTTTFVFDLPGMTDDEGNLLINYNASFLWMQLGHNGSPSDYYYPSFLEMIDDVYMWDLGWEFSIDTATLSSYVTSLASNTPDITFDSVILTLGYEAEYAGVVRSSMCSMTVSYTDCGLSATGEVASIALPSVNYGSVGTLSGFAA